MIAIAATYRSWDHPNGFGLPRATRDATVPAMIGPMIGMTSSTPVMRPRSKLNGTPNKVRPTVVTVHMIATRTSCPRT